MTKPLPHPGARTTLDLTPISPFRRRHQAAAGAGIPPNSATSGQLSRPGYGAGKSLLPAFLRSRKLASTCLALLLAGSLPLFGQTVNQWDKTLGGSAEESLQAMQQTSDGGYILGGWTRSATGGDISQPTKGYFDYWVVKLQADGTKAWDKVLGGNYDDKLTALQQTSDGGYILGGFSWSGKSGDKTAYSDDEGDYWVVKLDANGNKQWDKTIGGNGLDWLSSLQQTSDGGYILGGYSYCDFLDIYAWPRDNADYHVVKLNANGSVAWQRNFDGGKSDNLSTVQQTADGGYILGGHSASSMGWHKSEYSKGGTDFWVIKLTANGTKVWDKTIGSSGNDVLTALKQTPDGGYILGGNSATGIGGDKTQPSRGGEDFWVVKLKADGSKEWDRTLGGQGGDALAALQLAAGGGYLLGGTSASGISGDRTHASKGSNDFWLLKLDVGGNTSWDAVFGGADHDVLSTFQQTQGGGYVFAGGSASGISGDKTQAHRGGGDYWILKTGEIAPPPAPGTTLRINAGGGQLSAPQGAFAADGHFAPAPGFTYFSPTLIAGTDNDALYQSERSSPADNGSFSYALPVSSGKYSVILHFAELYWNAPGQRVFDVTLEGALALDDYDIVKKTGGKNIAATEYFLVTVTDNVLNINLSALAEEGGVNRPKISGIEVLPYTGPDVFPPAHAGADQTVTLPENNLIISGRGTETHGRVDVFTWTQVSGPNRASFYRYTSAPSVTNLQPGTYTFSFTVMDDRRAISAPDEVVITVLPDPNVPAVVAAHRIHAGGGQLTAGPGIFAADNYYSNGDGPSYSPTTTSTAFPIAGTQDDALYQTERTSEADNGAFSYDLPVANGSYRVVLHFAEIYWNARGQRVFDVAMEGNLVLDNYDIVKKTGVNFTATSESFVVEVSDGMLNIGFSALASAGGINRPKVSAIEVIPTSGTNQARIAMEGGAPLSAGRSGQELLGVKAYPNPFRQEISLDMAGAPAGDYTVRVLDLMGKEVYQSRFQVSSGAGQLQSLSLQGSSLTQGGIYLLAVEEATGALRQVIKMVKE
ncbi:MAG: malectin domain-containing carbohydrate-binding protein [Adhaeribacter sp.]